MCTTLCYSLYDSFDIIAPSLMYEYFEWLTAKKIVKNKFKCTEATQLLYMYSENAGVNGTALASSVSKLGMGNVLSLTWIRLIRKRYLHHVLL